MAHGLQVIQSGVVVCADAACDAGFLDGCELNGDGLLLTLMLCCQTLYEYVYLLRFLTEGGKTLADFLETEGAGTFILLNGGENG